MYEMVRVNRRHVLTPGDVQSWLPANLVSQNVVEFMRDARDRGFRCVVSLSQEDELWEYELFRFLDKEQAMCMVEPALRV